MKTHQVERRVLRFDEALSPPAPVRKSPAIAGLFLSGGILPSSACAAALRQARRLRGMTPKRRHVPPSQESLASVGRDCVCHAPCDACRPARGHPCRVESQEVTMHSGGLELALVFLLAAVIAVPVFKRFGLGAVLGYLAAGVVLGPYGLRVVQRRRAGAGGQRDRRGDAAVRDRPGAVAVAAAGDAQAGVRRRRAAGGAERAGAGRVALALGLGLEGGAGGRPRRWRCPRPRSGCSCWPSARR